MYYVDIFLSKQPILEALEGRSCYISSKEPQKKKYMIVLTACDFDIADIAVSCLRPTDNFASFNQEHDLSMTLTRSGFK